MGASAAPAHIVAARGCAFSHTSHHSAFSPGKPCSSSFAAISSISGSRITCFGSPGSSGRIFRLNAQHAHARGYLRPRAGYRLFEQREELVRRLSEDVKANREWLLESVEYLVAH